MHILFDARLYGTRHGGIGRYIEELLNALEVKDHDNTYTILLNEDGYRDYHPKNPHLATFLVTFLVTC